ncbi:PREDICTED: solute carrier family 15 member 4-like, partial [Amphimedon queenslandica]
EEAPSRLDPGKDKYGRPFTEEEVEDVKTILKLIPILIVNGFAVSFNGDIVADTNRKYYGCLELREGNIISGVYVFIILLHQFIIYPCFYKYIPSMLKRIGLGMGLIFAVNFYYTVLAFIGNYPIGDSFHCLTVLDGKSVTITHSWYIFSDIIVGVFLYINNVVLVEFFVAQCPKSMRGTIVGLWLCLRILRAYGILLFLPFLHYIKSGLPLDRGFYFFLSRDIFSVIAFVIYAFLAKRYKFRVRENEINIHMIAENHIIRNIEQEEENRIMERDYASNITITDSS